jgi:hypothetical protein
LGIYFPPDVAKSKVVSLLTILREQYEYWDIFTSCVLAMLTISMFIFGGRSLVTPIAIVAAFYFLAFLLCPDGLFGGYFADRRLLPYAVMVALLSIGIGDRAFADRRQRQRISILSLIALCLFVARIAVTASVWHDIAKTLDVHLALLNKIPEHSRIFSLFVERCQKEWPRGRLDHMQQLAIPLRKSMTNGQFQEGSLNQVKALFRKQGDFDPNMQGVVKGDECQAASHSFQSAIERFPRDKFDFVWLVSEAELPPFSTVGLHLLGSTVHDRLYRISDPYEK